MALATLAAPTFFIVVVLPTLALIVAAFRRFLFIPDAASLFDMRHYSLVHFESIFDNPLTLRSIWNTMEVGLITALVGGLLAFAIGYTVHRSHVPARRGSTSSPPCRWRSSAWSSASPISGPDRPARRGSTARSGSGRLALRRALHPRHHEVFVHVVPADPSRARGSLVCGRGRIGTIRSVALLLARPGTVAAMTLLFILAIRELGSSLFLYTSDTMVMAVLLLDYYEGGNTGKAAAFSRCRPCCSHW